MNTENNKEHIKNLLRWLIIEVCSAGGDGDAYWYSRYFTLDEILPILEEINSERVFKWEIEKHDKWINFGEGQEWLTITNDEELYRLCPDYVQAKIRW